MSHEARDILRLYKKLRLLTPETVTEQRLLKTLQYTIRTLQNNPLDYPLDCTRCGKCCTTSGYITLSQQELETIKEYLREKGIKKRPHITNDQDSISLNGSPCPLYYKAGKACMSILYAPRFAGIFHVNIYVDVREGLSGPWHHFVKQRICL